MKLGWNQRRIALSIPVAKQRWSTRQNLVPAWMRLFLLADIADKFEIPVEPMRGVGRSRLYPAAVTRSLAFCASTSGGSSGCIR